MHLYFSTHRYEAVYQTMIPVEIDAFIAEWEETFGKKIFLLMHCFPFDGLDIKIALSEKVVY